MDRIVAFACSRRSDAWHARARACAPSHPAAPLSRVGRDVCAGGCGAPRWAPSAPAALRAAWDSRVERGRRQDARHRAPARFLRRAAARGNASVRDAASCDGARRIGIGRIWARMWQRWRHPVGRRIGRGRRLRIGLRRLRRPRFGRRCDIVLHEASTDPNASRSRDCAPVKRSRPRRTAGAVPTRQMRTRAYRRPRASAPRGRAAVSNPGSATANSHPR